MFRALKKVANRRQSRESSNNNSINNGATSINLRSQSSISNDSGYDDDASVGSPQNKSGNGKKRNSDSSNRGGAAGDNTGGGGGVAGGLVRRLSITKPNTSSKRQVSDAYMERQISTAAIRLVEDIQKVVVDAKLGGQANKRRSSIGAGANRSTRGNSGNSNGRGQDHLEEDWRDKLLRILGGTDQAVANRRNSNSTSKSSKEYASDIDILLENSNCDKFILRCMENELPPNLIHCMRLLRVVELKAAHSQSAAAAAAKAESNTTSTGEEENQNQNQAQPQKVRSVSKAATEKVQKLLSLLCGDASVGEQLRPHLFGLLALSGARYPINGVHVARAASKVIVSFSKGCLSTSLVWFLHDRNMIVHMTDDVKELCGMTAAAASSNTASLTFCGKEAECHGLWIYALTAIVYMVKQSCLCKCSELLKDFEAAGGYHVLRYAMANSGRSHLKKLLKLTVAIMYCKVESPDDNDDDDDTSLATADYTDTLGQSDSLNAPVINEEHLVTNPSAFDVIEDLMDQSIPLLVMHRQDNESGMSINSTDDIRAFAKLSLDFAVQIFEEGFQGRGEVLDKNIDSEIMLCVMQMFSDNPGNFSVIEGQYDVLTKFLLAFPTFNAPEVKDLTLKTLAYACTGLHEADCWKPLTVASEMFFSLSKSLLRMSIDVERAEKNKYAIEMFREDAALLCNTLEKLLQVLEESLGKIMIEAGILGEVLHEILSLVVMAPIEQHNESRGSSLDISSGVDTVYCSVCQILDLILKSSIAVTSLSTARLDSPNKQIYDSSIPSGGSRSVELDAFLKVGITDLSLTAANSALLVFESKMYSADDDTLQVDIDSIINILKGVIRNIRNLSAQSPTDDSTRKRDFTEYVLLSCSILEMVTRVLGNLEAAQDTFRLQGGFELLLRLLLCLQSGEDNCSVDRNDSTCHESTGVAKMSLVKAIYGVLDAGTMPVRKDDVASSRVDDLLGEELDGMSKSAAMNRVYITSKGIYESLVKALQGIGLFDKPENALAVLNLSLGLLHPGVRISLDSEKNKDEADQNIEMLRNPDATKLVLGIAVSLPKEGLFVTISEHALNVLIQLCSSDNAGTTLDQIANCGLCRTLISFSNVFDDFDHPLYFRFVALLRRVASFKMTYMDFVALLRFIGHPLLASSNSSGTECSDLRLPLISSSVRFSNEKTSRSKKFEESESNGCLRLKTLSVIAKRGDRVARCLLGGDSLNNIASSVEKGVGLDEKLYLLAEKGFTRFLEIDKIQAVNKVPIANDTSNPANTNLWSPAHTTGFSYSLWLRLPICDEVTGNVCIFDVSSNMTGGSEVKSSSGRPEFISIWYDLLSQGFNVISSASTKPICFPASPISPDVWHHVLLTYQPPKRAVLSRKAVIGICVDGRPLEVDIKIDAVPLPPTSCMYVGVPNPMLSSSGIIRGALPVWELGSMLLLSRILGPRDAVSMYCAGPEFHGQFWGDRPQRLSLSATATSVFSMLAKNGDKISVATGLRKRGIQEIEGASYVMRDKILNEDRGVEGDPAKLSAVKLSCRLSPEFIIGAFHPSSSTKSMRDNSAARKKKHFSRRLVNVARINSTNDLVSSDAIVYGKGSVISPASFAENVQWVGGPNILLPIIHASKSHQTLALTLRVLRESAHEHVPNLEMLHIGGGYRMLAMLLLQKSLIDEVIIEHCFALAVKGFEPTTADERGEEWDPNKTDPKNWGMYSWLSSDNWVLVDLDAMKFLLKNHQVWNVQSSGPLLTLRVASLLNGLVSTTSYHCSFNARRLHLLGMVKWTIHLMLEVTELYANGILGEKISKSSGHEQKPSSEALYLVLAAFKNGWVTKPLSVGSTVVGGDPGVALLLAGKTFLRRVLAHMLTPDDLGDIAGAVIYTSHLNIKSDDLATQCGHEMIPSTHDEENDEFELSMGAVTRIYLLRLLEELAVDGINEITAASTDGTFGGGGNSSSNIHDLSPSKGSVGRNAQLFLSAFSMVLTPAWFALVLEGCRDESSASAAFRLLIVLLQNSPSFATSFEKAGGFAPLVSSIPKHSTSASIILAMLSQLLHAPLLHLPCFGALDPEQLCAIFDTESDDTNLISRENNKGGISTSANPTGGIFAIIAECLGRNIQLGAMDNELGLKARKTNNAVLHLLTHCHSFSFSFQQFCRSPDFLEPIAQSLCLVHNDKLLKIKSNPNIQESLLTVSGGNSRDETVFFPWPSEKDGEKSLSESTVGSDFAMERRGCLIPQDTEELSATARFVGEGNNEKEGGLGLVRLLRHTINRAVFSGPKAAELVSALFQSFPIHASSEQVEAFHMVLLEQCHIVVEDALHRGELIALANCIGISSVLLDRLLMGFFTSEPILEAFYTIMSTLQAVSYSESYAYRTLCKEDPECMIRSNAAHVARMTCLVALQRSKPAGPWDLGDEMLQQKVIMGINNSLEYLFFSTTGNINILTRRKNQNNAPAPGSRLYNFWQSTSLKRCDSSSDRCKFPDISEVNEPDRAFVVSLMAEVRSLLDCKNEGLRQETAILIKCLMKQRQGIMSDLLTRNVPLPGGVIKNIDLINGGGFGALLLYNISHGATDDSLEQLRLQTFFDWIEVNSQDIDEVFNLISRDALSHFPSLFSITVPSPEDAIEQEQKEMFVKKFASDGGIALSLAGAPDRHHLAEISNARTENSQAVWKRQGLDDLSSGAMLWKSLLRQLKGSCSLWEGGNQTIAHSLSPEARNKDGSVRSPNGAKSDAMRWKLDVTEGYERQRKKLLPNYEFYSLYNVKEGFDSTTSEILSSQKATDVPNASIDAEGATNATGISFKPSSAVEATADLLKQMELSNIEVKDEDEDAFDDDEYDVSITEAELETVGLQADASIDSADMNNMEDIKTSQKKPQDFLPDDQSLSEASDDEILSEDENDLSEHQHHYDLITGLLHSGDIPEKSYNVERCTGLEVCKALLLRCGDAIYIIDGFEQTDEDGLKGNINRVERATSTFHVNIRSQTGIDIDPVARSEQNDIEKKKTQVKNSTSDASKYQHRCKRLAHGDLYAVYRRRYQLQPIALEFYDDHNNGTFIAFSNQDEREEILSILLHSDLPNSIFNSGPSVTSPNYDKFMKSLRSKIANQWVQGKMTNFDFIMHLNSFAGRSYNDLTQYPVFPWVIADYESDEIDLKNPNVYRDLSKPMGALGLARAEQFKERYEALDSNYASGDEPPAFHYGTHYSCAAYVLNYLLRLEPFSRLALSLQGGKFDLADRIFHNIGASWKSASRDNLQDVRELIPEFFYLPEFLENGNSFDLGVKQDGCTVHHVTLPPWAKGDPRRFVRINRQALESEHVSRNLHKWVDLIFGYKQRGREAISALNTFVHVTYAGTVDINAIEDPIQRESIIAQIQNFGQTPTRLERRPFPARNILPQAKDGSIVDYNSLALLEHLTPPFCVVGAPHAVRLRLTMNDFCKVGMIGQSDASVGDMCLSKGQLIGVGKTCGLIPSTKKYYRFGGSNNGISFHVGIPTVKNWEVNRVHTIHDDMHRAPITSVKPSRDGQWLVTGCLDSTVRVWKYENDHVDLQASLCGHEGAKITCIDICTTFGTIITGADDGTVLMWDLRTLSFLRELDHIPQTDRRAMPKSVKSVSLNDKTGDVLILVDSKVTIFDINGNLVATMNPRDILAGNNRASCAISTDCPEWTDHGIVAITGHVDGNVILWGIDRDEIELIPRFQTRSEVQTQIHMSPITCLRIEGKRQNALLCGDKSGKTSLWKTIHLDAMSQDDHAKVVMY